MKTQPAISPKHQFLVGLFCVVLGLALLAVALAANAQPLDTNAPAPAAPSTLNSQLSTSGVEAWIINLAATHPSVVGFLALLGVVRFCIKPVMTLIRKAAPSQNENLDRIEHSLPWAGFLFLLDWLCSIKVTKSDAKAATKVTLLLLVPLGLLGATGCAGRTSAQVIRAMAKDPASLHVRVTTIYGTIEVARTAPQTNTPPHSIGENGAITVRNNP